MDFYVVIDTEQGRMYFVQTDNHVRAMRLVHDQQIDLMSNEERKRRGLMQVNSANYKCIRVELKTDRVIEVHPIWLQTL